MPPEPLDPRVKRVAQALCRCDRGPLSHPTHQCKMCRNAQYDGDEWIDLGEGCLGYGYAPWAEAAIKAADDEQENTRMIQEGERLDKDIKRLERELERPIDDKRRREIQAAIKLLKAKRRNWEKPR